jgi:glycosyltransferase involved in cell wall biosynthesis
MREWIRPGENGLLVDATNPGRMAEAMAQALESPDLRRQAAEVNARQIAERAAVEVVRPKIEAFYRRLVEE